ncbi:unnamed protein product [Clavelina lepadiformis]|uniref:RING-type E3 ubiquitin transferase n=1 Tax=Clavelina lepadiformis TaxID=159417 RepID=A0ABP0GCG3_CLALP
MAATVKDSDEVKDKDLQEKSPEGLAKNSPGTPERCAICLAPPENKAVTDSCFHAFCFSCLKEWSKVKAVCPLCKNEFRYILYNVRANDDYDRFEVPKPEPDPLNNHLQGLNFNFWLQETNHVVDHWMSSRMYEWRQRIQLEQENTRAALVASTNVDIIRQRRVLYRHRIQVSHVNNNKQIRDISSTFFRENPAQIHRLAPWLKRELIVVFGSNNMMLVNRVCDLILSAVSTLGITSTDFYNEIRPYFHDRTDHFLKEFISFASSPHDLPTYDSNARYDTSSSRRHWYRMNRSWSSSDDESLMTTVPGYSRCPLLGGRTPQPPPLAHVRDQFTLERRRTLNERLRSSLNQAPPKKPSRSAKKKRKLTTQIPAQNEIVVIDSSPEPTTSQQQAILKHESGDDCVEFVKYVKPPHLRTPDAVIELSSSSEADVSGPSNFEAAADDQPKHSTFGSGSDSNVTVKLKSVVVPVIKDSSSQAASSSEQALTSSMLSSLPSSSQSPDLTPRERNHSNTDSSTPGTASIRHLTSSPEKLRQSSTDSQGQSSHEPSRSFHKVYERKRASMNALSRYFLEKTRRQLSDSEDDSSSDYASAYLPVPKRNKVVHKTMKHKKRKRLSKLLDDFQ